MSAADAKPQLVRDGGGIVEVAVRRGREAALADDIGRLAGVALPSARWSCRNDLVRAIWLAPGRWWILAPPALCASIEAVVPEDVAAVIDQSSGYSLMTIESESVEAVLATHCRLDLDLRAFPVDRATRTLFGQIGIVLWRESVLKFGLAVPSTLANSAGPSDQDSN